MPRKNKESMFKTYFPTINFVITKFVYIFSKPRAFYWLLADLSWAYIVLVPALDVLRRISDSIGNLFLDSRGGISTFEFNLYIFSFVPMIILAVLWSYGRFRLDMSEKKYTKNSAIYRASTLFVGSVASYFVTSFIFGFYYHF